MPEQKFLINDKADSGLYKKSAGDKIYDLAVVGAGPAGSLAAALAAKAGFSTVILEQKYFPRHKICGGFISERSLSLLPEDLILPPEISNPVNRLTVTRGNKSSVYTSEKMLGLIIKRERFDNYLAGYACNKGAVLFEGTALVGLEKEDIEKTGQFYYLLQIKNPLKSTLRARYVIGADGAYSRCGSLSGLRKKINYRTGWGLAKFVEIESRPEKPGTLNFFPLPFLGGMGWSFNGPGWVNQGVGGLANRSLLLKAYHWLFPEDKEYASLPVWPLPFLGPLAKAASGNLLLVGDAAGLIEPFSGEGLCNTFKSAILSVQALIRAESENKTAASIYQGSFNKIFRKNFPADLAGAALLHVRSVISPSSLPQLMAALMENKLWFNRDFKISTLTGR
jgi:menaquinone-9 beta-reductase